MSTYSKDSAQLEREVEEQRQKIESRIGEIRERLSPGQIVDELLSYTKNGGQHFAANLGQTVSNNPLPAALLGISLVWLMSGQGPKLSMPHSEPARPRSPEYPYATVSGGMRRVGHAADAAGDWYSDWEDSTGKRYKAKSNELGHRASEFIDDAGRKFGGFIDETGHRVRDFQDEAGNRFDDAMGWASHTFHDAQHGLSQAADQVSQQAQQLGANAQQQVDRTTRMAMDMFRDQPLVAGALAFAAGAAIGAALPHTDQEDQAIGKVSDKVKKQAADAALDVYEEGKAGAAELYQKGKEGAAQVYSDARDSVTDRVRNSDLH
jgi:ElaB/YqjD/DUF883 family membrane-anchored ribosome-binding protein